MDLEQLISQLDRTIVIVTLVDDTTVVATRAPQYCSVLNIPSVFMGCCAAWDGDRSRWITIDPLKVKAIEPLSMVPVPISTDSQLPD
jgi:hypothetical protein